jgi:hypothetical protein
MSSSNTLVMPIIDYRKHPAFTCHDYEATHDNLLIYDYITQLDQAFTSAITQRTSVRAAEFTSIAIEKVAESR